jgi:hypothetical protein
LDRDLSLLRIVEPGAGVGGGREGGREGGRGGGPFLFPSVGALPSSPGLAFQPPPHLLPPFSGGGGGRGQEGEEEGGGRKGRREGYSIFEGLGGGKGGGLV